jgi:hypothetical protein
VPTANALVRAWRSGGLFGKDPIDSRDDHAECRSDGAGRFTAGVHPLRQSGTDGLPELPVLGAALASSEPT